MFLYFIERDIKQLTEDKRYGYVTYQDIRSVESFREKTVLVVKAPPETELQVPQVHYDGEVRFRNKKLYYLYLVIYNYFTFKYFSSHSKKCT